MESVVSFLDSYGYWLLLALGFAEFSGIPIASVPALIAAGGLAAAGGLSLPVVALCAAAGGLLADLGWYGVARWQGRRLVGAACGLSTNPGACVLGVESKLARIGAPYILSAKFLPGAANLIAPAAGFRAVPFARFLALDAVALLLWASVYSTVGWLLSDQVEGVIVLAARLSLWVLTTLLLLGAGAVALRLVKRRRHRSAHERSARCGEGEENPPGEPTAGRALPSPIVDPNRPMENR